jgi:signal transduction histidine kinase
MEMDSSMKKTAPKKKMKNLLTARFVLVFGIFAIVIFIVVLFVSTSAMKSNVIHLVENKIYFIKSYCDEKNNLIKQITDKDLVKLARYHVGKMTKRLQYKEGNFYFSDRNGIIRIHYNENMVGKKIKSSAVIRELKKIAQDEKIHISNFSDDIVFYSYYKNWNLFIIYTEKKENIFRPVTKIRNILILVSFLVISSSIWLSRKFTVKFSAPIEELSNISTSLHQGKMSDNWPEGKYYEVDNLSENLRKLFDSLNKRNNELENINIELNTSIENERRVSEEMQIAQVELEELNSELEEALVKAEEANKLKSEFLAIISHELRTPLSGILGFSYLLLSDKTLDDNQRKKSDYINKSGKRLLNVVNDLLTISMIEAGKIVLNYDKFNLAEVIEDIRLLFEDGLTSKKLDFISDIGNIKDVYSDQSRIRQILLNLIGNALKFTEKGSIRVEVREDKAFYYFQVMDTGIGIKFEDTDKIFEMFKQVEDAFQRKYQGAGLGLAICKKLIEALGGTIRVKSSLNEYTVFYFQIPKVENKSTDIFAIKAPLELEKKPELNNANILFAEDDETSFKYLEELFKKQSKYKLRGFINAEELLQEFKINNNEYSIVLLDIQLPNMDGVTCFKEIRKINETIPVVALTAFASKNDREKFLNQGFSDYISKPFDTSNLMSVIERFV